MVFCTYCGHSFTRDEHLERHILTRKSSSTDTLSPLLINHIRHQCQAFQVLHLPHVVCSPRSSSKTLHRSRPRPKPTRDTSCQWYDPKICGKDAHRLQQLRQDKDKVRQEVSLQSMLCPQPSLHTSTHSSINKEC